MAFHEHFIEIENDEKIEKLFNKTQNELIVF